MIEAKSIKIIKRSLVEEIIEDELLLFNEDTEEITILNKTATILWNMLRSNGELNFNELCNNFYNFFSDKPSYKQVVNDVDETLKYFFESNLIEIFYDEVSLTNIINNKDDKNE